MRIPCACGIGESMHVTCPQSVSLPLRVRHPQVINMSEFSG